MFRKCAPLVGVAALALIAWRVAISCGPFIPEAQFHEEHNWIDRTELLKGRIGIVRPEFFHKSLLAAYRSLIAMPLSHDEVDALFPENPPNLYSIPGPVEAAAQAWLTARMTVYPTQLPGGIYFEGGACLANAFETATAALKARIALWGANSPNTAEWLHGQDQVFSECNQGTNIPAALPANSDPTLAADRRYQIAAAEFYSASFANALRDFDAIAADSQSEWRGIARYVAARVLIREASLTDRLEPLSEAQKRLQAVVADPSESSLHASARGLLDLIQVRQDPGAYLLKTADLLSRPGLGNGILQTFNGFNLVWDHVKPLPTSQPGLIDWIYSVQTPSAAAHAIARWRETHTPVWLVAALEHAAADSPDALDLISATAAIKPSQPAYATATYLGVRLQTARNRDSARQWVDAALSRHQPPSVDNAFRSERLALARSWTEFLRYAPRTPVAETVETVDQQLGASDRSKLFDDDAATALSEVAPVTKLIEAAHSPLLPRNLRLQVALAAWTRAAILQDATSAKDLSNLLTQIQPSLSADLNTFLTASDAASAHFAAVFLMLHNPGLHPTSDSGYSRSENLNRLDAYRSNWWILRETSPVPPSATAAPKSDPIDYLTPQEISQGHAEYAQLLKLAPVAPDYLSQVSIEWARKYPSDPRAPEALALAVRSTRYGVTDKETTNWSKAAFLLLHRNYPNSVWAQRTKYWF